MCKFIKEIFKSEDNLKSTAGHRGKKQNALSNEFLVEVGELPMAFIKVYIGIMVYWRLSNILSMYAIIPFLQQFYYLYYIIYIIWQPHNKSCNYENLNYNETYYSIHYVYNYGLLYQNVSFKTED